MTPCIAVPRTAMGEHTRLPVASSVGFDPQSFSPTDSSVRVMNTFKHAFVFAALLLFVVASRANAGSGSLCCPSDIDGDAIVGAPDLAIVLGAWGPAGPSEAADIDASGEVDATDLALVLGSWGTCPSPCLKTQVVGVVTLADGTALPNAVVVTDLGGQGVSGGDGAFSFEVEVGQQASALTVTAVASIRGVTYTGTKLVSPIALDGVTDSGTIIVSAEASCSGEFGWLPGFGLPGLNAEVYTLTIFDDGSGGGPALYAGGWFTSAGGVSANHVAKWNGTSWSSLGTGSANGVNDWIWALTVFDDGSGGGPALYAGGDFTTAGGVTANRIAKWNGTSWSKLGTGSANGVGGGGAFGPIVRALTIFDDGWGGGPALYAGGDFTTAGGVAANYVAKWNGTSWSSLGTSSANGVNNQIWALTVFDDGSGGGPALYAGGFFTAAGGVTANRIAKWDGTAWSSLGTGAANGVNNSVNALTVFDDGSGGGPALYAGGFFTTAGGVTANRIAKWNGTSWSSLGTGSANGVNNQIWALTVFDDGSGGGPALYAGGDFTTAGGVTANRVAKWDGTSWSSLGTGSANGVAGGLLSPLVNALTVFDDGSDGGPALYVGGRFTSAGGVPSSYIAKWGCVTSNNNAPARPQPAVVARGDRRTPTTAASPTADRTLRRAESLILGDESLRFGTLTALPGSILRLAHPGAHLIVTNLIIEPGATFEWLAGTIEIDAGAWLHPYDLTIGCDREAKLLLTADAFVRAPQLTICGLGSLVGQGSVDAPTTNAGTVAGAGSGLRILGPYGHEPSGTVAAAVAELASIALDQLHPCVAVDELIASNEIEPIQRIDVDRDGDLDLVRRVRVGGDAVSLLWFDRGDGSFGSPILCGSDLPSQRVSVDHLDDDELLDLLITTDEGLRCHALSGGMVEVLR
jgi:hypothetical protein